jgi:hypothetical protein
VFSNNEGLFFRSERTTAPPKAVSLERLDRALELITIELDSGSYYFVHDLQPPSRAPGGYSPGREGNTRAEQREPEALGGYSPWSESRVKARAKRAKGGLGYCPRRPYEGPREASQGGPGGYPQKRRRYEGPSNDLTSVEIQHVKGHTTYLPSL